MNYTPLDPKNAVILFADLQAGILELAATNDPIRIRRAVGALAKLARLFEIPVVVTTAPADGGARVTPEIAAALGQLMPLRTRQLATRLPRSAAKRSWSPASRLKSSCSTRHCQRLRMALGFRS